MRVLNGRTLVITPLWARKLVTNAVDRLRQGNLSRRHFAVPLAQGVTRRQKTLPSEFTTAAQCDFCVALRIGVPAPILRPSRATAILR